LIARLDIFRYAGAYERAVGAHLEPGSLNVLLDEPWVLREPQARLEASEVGVRIAFVVCLLNGERGWAVRTDKNNAGMGDHPLTVVEVVSDVHLRTALDLRDGDEVALELVR